MNLNGKIITTNKGTPQGSTISSDNWNYYVADLIKELKQIKGPKIDPKLRHQFSEEHLRINPPFFNDDLAIIVHGEK